MRIAVFGLGYVGAVSMAALADRGHQVFGVDPNTDKVATVNDGRSPVVENGLGELIRSGVAGGRIGAVADPAALPDDLDLSIICVGTPSRENGSLDLRQVEAVSEQIGSVVLSEHNRHTVVVRSTMVPGSTAGTVIPALERSSGLIAGRDFGVCTNPEFLREGSSIRDYFSPPFTVVGTDDDETASALRELYAGIDADFIVVPSPVAEMLKYASNSFHALKVTFANEIGAVCDEHGVDGRELMDLFARDTKLNISAAYLQPGFAYGGSCLPKDLRALVHHARSLDLEAPVLEAIDRSNRLHIERALRRIIRLGRPRVGVLGLSFKAGTDDLRESPSVELTERLIGKGLEVSVYDHNVSLARLHGSNRAFISQEIPHIASLLKPNLWEVIDQSDVLVLANSADEFRDLPKMIRNGQELIDLVGLLDEDHPGTTYSENASDEIRRSNRQQTGEST